MGWGFKREFGEGEGGFGDLGLIERVVLFLLLPFLRVEDGRYWRYANPSIQASNQIESPHNPDRREEYVCK